MYLLHTRKIAKNKFLANSPLFMMIPMAQLELGRLVHRQLRVSVISLFCTKVTVVLIPIMSGSTQVLLSFVLLVAKLTSTSLL